ncbi:Endoribonuclease L-psp [Popillia japonica]|uniref:Endoribonuclease L-psp n=1 Tax=Popillia japonica TaxID=7064 RepID=A0AAW1JE36_POPJA
MSTIIRRIIATVKAPKPVGPYNQAVALDRTVYFSGVLGLNKDSMKLVDGGAVAEARQALQNLGQLLEAADSSYDKVVKTNIFLTDMNDFSAVNEIYKESVNEIYKEYFKKDFPARSTFQVSKLPLGATVEIEAIAASGNVKTV